MSDGFAPDARSASSRPAEPPTAAELRRRARKISKGHVFEDFSVGQTFDHHWGRTVHESDNALFGSLTLHYTPLYLNDVYARALGHAAAIINPYLVFLIVFGLSVEDLSEAGIAFLGVDDLTFHDEVRPGDTLTARSTVRALRRSTSHSGAGIATWHTEGYRDDQRRVIDFTRTNLIKIAAQS
jgi:acyl dehydratase